MDVLLDWKHYHRFNIILLSVVGLWPYGNKFILRLERIAGSFFATCCCFAQIKRVTETINDDWKKLASKEEMAIIEKYIDRGKFHTMGFAMFICPAMILLLLAPYSYAFLDLVVPLNESRNPSFPIMFEFFLDQEEHFFLTAIAFDGAIAVGGLVFVSTEALLIVYIQHACALFEVTSHRIKNLLPAVGARNSNRSNNMVVIGHVAEIHCRAIRHCKTIREDFLPSYIILFVLGVLSMSTNLYRCTQTFTTHEFNEFLISAMFCFAILGYMFYFNFVAQGLLVSSGNIFHDLYDTNWYASSISTRKLVTFCMLNSVKPVGIDVCGLYFPSYEGFCLVVKMATSYAAALYSLT